MKRRILGALALVLLAALPFAPGLGGGWIGDDVPIIAWHEGLRAGASPLDLFGETWWRQHGAGGLYRPLTQLSFSLDRLVWGADAEGAPAPFGIHLTNLLLNAAATLLVYSLLRPGVRAGAAWLGAALFAVHPVHVEAVVHLVGRADLLCALLFLAAWRLQRAGGAARAAAVACTAGAVLAKEMAVVLPVVLLFDGWLGQKAVPQRAPLRRQLAAVAPHVLAVAGVVGLRGAVLGASLTPPRAWALAVPGRYRAFEDAGPLEVGFTMLHAFGEYLRLLLFPLELSADYSGFPRHATPGAEVALSLLAWGAVVLLVALAWRRGEREPARWLGVFAITMLPVSNLLVGTGIVMAERVLYLPSVALAGAVAWGADRLLARRAAWGAVFAIALALLALQSARRAPVWSDPRTLYEATVETGRYPGHVAFDGLVGAYLEELGRRDDPALRERAIDVARRSVDAFPSYSTVQKLSLLLLREGRLAESLAAWELLLERSPDQPLYRQAVRDHLDALLHDARRRGDEAAARDLAERRAALERAPTPR